MKKNAKMIIITFILLFLFIILVSINSNKKDNYKDDDIIYLSNHLTDEEIEFIYNNDIDIERIKPYLVYNNFNVYNFFSYERIKEDYNLSNLEAINHYNNPNYYNFYNNPKPALFIETPITLVNKCFYLDSEFVPNDLVNVNEYDIDFIIRENEVILLKKEVLENYKDMYNDAKINKIDLVIFSGYRSYDKQKHLYYEAYKEDDSISARPGFSEHQTGYAVDISTRTEGLTELFENSKSYKWLLENSYKYGFILRYPKNKTKFTGYQFEPWHFRYVGNVASDIHFQETTLEEYIFSNLEI